MFVPEAYITATRQFVAQANNWSLEELTLEVTSFCLSFPFFYAFLFFLPPPPPPPTPVIFHSSSSLVSDWKKTLLKIVRYLYLVKGIVLRLMFIVGLVIVNVTKVTFLPIVLNKRICTVNLLNPKIPFRLSLLLAGEEKLSWLSFFKNLFFKVTIANGPDDRLTIDDCSFGIKGIISLCVYPGIRS